MSHRPDNIFAGTQVLSLVEARGTNNSLVHPRGPVGVVTRTPTGDQNQFLVRFPDGFESSLTYDRLEVLKHFEARLDNVLPTSCRQINQTSQQDAGTMFGLESFIIYHCVVGSRASGLDNDDSDTDRRGIYLAPANLQWSLFGAPEQFEDDATQSCYWELQKFLTMALKANPNILECLYSPMVEKVTPLGEELLALCQRFLSQMIFQTFNGYRPRRQGALCHTILHEHKSPPPASRTAHFPKSETASSSSAQDSVTCCTSSCFILRPA